ncbi:MAG TPA: hypothetical protein VLN91_07245 [Nitrospirota bacterium]|nr:hypothetical protein [Nitrospirota bacterium]
MNLRLPVTVPLLAAFLAFSSPSMAVDLLGQSRTYLQSREEIDSSKLLPFFEYLDFKADDVGSKNVSFHFGGWLRYDLRDDSTLERNKNSDLQYAYLSIKGDRADAAMNLGRVLVNEGVASGQVDGAYVRTALKGGFGVAAFGGSPVETTFDDRSGDSVYGGRISHSVEDVYRIGFSYLKEKNNSMDFRKEEGVDLWLRPISKVELLGESFYNALTSDWMKHSYYLTLGQFSHLSFRTAYTQISYKDYFTSATTTAFKLDPTIIDPNEKLSTIGEEVSFNAGVMTVAADYKKYQYEIAGDANYYGGKLTFSSSLKGGLGIAYHRMYGATDKLRYNEYRAYAFTSFGLINVTADCLVVRYDEEINGVRNAYAVVLAGGYTLTPKAKIGVDVEYEKNPNFNSDVRGLIKFVYNFDFVPAAKGRK